VYRQSPADHALPLTIAGLAQPKQVDSISGLLLKARHLFGPVSHKMTYPGTEESSDSNQNNGSN